MGSWVSYGLGSENRGPAGVRRHDLARPRRRTASRLYDRLWGSGFLPTRYQGVKFRSVGDPGPVSLEPARASRRRIVASILDALQTINEDKLEDFGDPGDLDAHRAI